MKKVIALFVAIILSNCEIKIEPKKVNAQSVSASYQSYKFSTSTISGMTYGIWVADGISSTASAIYVVNLTKDALEVELLKKQLNK